MRRLLLASVALLSLAAAPLASAQTLKAVMHSDLKVLDPVIRKLQIAAVEAIARVTKSADGDRRALSRVGAPEVIEDLEALFAAERFRFANHLAAWIEVTDGVVVDAGYSGRGYISRTRVGGRHGIVFHPAAFPEIRHEPQVTAAGAPGPAAGRTSRPLITQ